MALSVGDKLGHYEVLSLLGAGGMGEVWKTRDTTLKRDVALKVLPASLLGDPDRMARFQREAEVLASLDHPNIGHIHGIVDLADSRGLILALIEGPTLCDRIEAGPIPLDEAVAIAKQIIEALEYAHDRGVVHRDLKPANIKITPDGVVKVLDFGLAKVLETEPPKSSLSDSPTMTLGHTRAGVILGTAAYMSPEQAVGRPVDRRTDIFSFGAVLYEMLTGKRAFRGAATPDVLEAVVRNEPDWSKLPPGTPAYLHLLLRRTLAKDRKQRLQAIGEARIALENPERGQESASASVRPKLGWSLVAAATLIAIALTALAFFALRETPQAEPSLRLSIQLPDKFQVGYFALSQDGSTLAITPASGAKSQIWLRDLNSLDLRPLANTDGARAPFWSPDSRSLGFFADGKLKTIPISGGPATALCDSGGGTGAWNREGVILFGSATLPIQQVNAAGGACVPVTQNQPGVRHLYPESLPDGKHFLYLLQDENQGRGGTYLDALDRRVGRRLLPDPSSAIFVPPRKPRSHGHLLFEREGTLMAQPFDADTLQLAGEVRPIASQLSRTLGTEQVAASAAGNGTLVYLAGSSRDEFQLTWLNRSGNELGKVGPLGYQRAISLSPNQKTVALGYTPVGSRQGRWLRDLARDVETPFVPAPLLGTLVWSPDSSRIAFSRPTGVYVKNAGGGPEELVLSARGQIRLSDWSRDGKYLLYTDNDPKARGDIWVLPFDSPGKPGAPFAFLKTEFNESEGQFSPDRHWVAYVSNESGRSEVYVRPFPSGNGAVRVSNRGGQEPRWRANGEELYYVVLGNPAKLMAVSVKSGSSGSLEIGVPKPLFDWQTLGMTPEVNYFTYSPDADGQRFLMNVLPDAALPTLNVITNWENAATAK